MKTADSAAHKGMLQQKCDQTLLCLRVGLGTRLFTGKRHLTMGIN